MGELDLPDRLAPAVPRWATQIGVALLCAGGYALVRVVLDIVAPGSAPFALAFPAMILATLFARWPAGALTAAISIGYAWRFIFLQQITRTATDVTGLRTMLVISVSAAITIFFAESFRLAVRHAVAARDREIADRDLFLAEFDHRMKNNFAIVAGLLDMQKRRAEEPATIAALETARMRVESIAQAHRHLYRGGDAVDAVEIHDYLGELCEALAKALFLSGKVTLRCEADPSSVPRDRAVSIGLVVNELVTNAAKHAFVGREHGHITVGFRARAQGGWLLTVADDGVGMPPGTGPMRGERGLGTRLIDAFARQADGRIDSLSGPNGTAVTLEING